MRLEDNLVVDQYRTDLQGMCTDTTRVVFILNTVIGIAFDSYLYLRVLASDSLDASPNSISRHVHTGLCAIRGDYNCSQSVLIDSLIYV